MTLKDRFDLVIFDGPDARQTKGLRALFPAVGKIVLVAPDEGADPRSLQRLLGRLRLPPEKFAGFVRAAPMTDSPWREMTSHPDEDDFSHEAD